MSRHCVCDVMTEPDRQTDKWCQPQRSPDALTTEVDRRSDTQSIVRSLDPNLFGRNPADQRLRSSALPTTQEQPKGPLIWEVHSSNAHSLGCDTQWHSTNGHRWSVFWLKYFQYFLWSTIASLISTSSLRSVRDLLLKTSRSQLWRLISEDLIISSIDSTTLEDIIDSRVEEVWHHFRSVFDRYLWSNAKKRFADNSSLKQLNWFLIKINFNRLLIIKILKYSNNYYKMIWNNFKPTVNQLIYWIEVSFKQ